MELAVHSFDKKELRKIAVADTAFGEEFKEGLVHQVVIAYLANARAGSKAQKPRSGVRGGGTKPWRQKGTGRARAGSIRSPLWRCGGVTFAATPRDFSQKVNRKMYHRAMVSILSELIRGKRLTVIENLKLKEPKTRELKGLLVGLNIEKALIILDGQDRNIELASRNMIDVTTSDSMRVNPISLVAAENVLITVDALKKLEERLS
ncbi:50S ribosomal protein L4 [Candidatus Coxiella mudrowiae]|uniref:Large ribosomal subunit protein uL4 n=1 Tax=Candidatus Coxiella mudrowiae TaxID=2054173 RepID=A0ABN4HRL2_9COXI|nr:50S ribosomal protein L4 [Candidatus Coxiella mudrowiae]AKQ33916.1 50S ribosomal protein L4 [Candidatus Coxiella mudrowiae]